MLEFYSLAWKHGQVKEVHHQMVSINIAAAWKSRMGCIVIDRGYCPTNTHVKKFYQTATLAAQNQLIVVLRSKTADWVRVLWPCASHLPGSSKQREICFAPNRFCGCENFGGRASLAAAPAGELAAGTSAEQDYETEGSLRAPGNMDRATSLSQTN